MARPTQHVRGVTERPCASLKSILVWYPAILHRDLAVLNNLQRNLVLNLLDGEPGRSLVLDDEALYLVVGNVARPDDRDVAPRSIADPSLLAVQDPGVAFALRRCRHTAGRSRADKWLGQAETA